MQDPCQRRVGPQARRLPGGVAVEGAGCVLPSHQVGALRSGSRLKAERRPEAPAVAVGGEPDRTQWPRPPYTYGPQ